MVIVQLDLSRCFGLFWGLLAANTSLLDDFLTHLAWVSTSDDGSHAYNLNNFTLLTTKVKIL